MKGRTLSVLLIILVLIVTGITASAVESEKPIIERAKVLEVIPIDEGAEDSFFIERKLVKLQILSGEYKGQQFEINHNLTGSYGYDITVKQGDRVLVTVEEEIDGTIAIYISEYVRDTYIYIVIGVFLILLILMGGIKGIKTIATLLATLLIILKVLLPGLLKGYNPIALTVGISFVITIVTLLFIGGMNRKSYGAIIGVLGGVFAAGIIAYIVGSMVKLTGLSNQEAMMLMYIPQNVEFDFRGLLFAGIIIGALGAVMDVGMSIASSMEEIKSANPNISVKELMKSGMNVGRDIMGTMANTLILAYTGSAIPLLLLFTAYQDPLTRIINLDLIATEIIRAFSGSIGLILSIPLTVVAMGILTEKFDNSKKFMS